MNSSSIDIKTIDFPQFQLSGAAKELAASLAGVSKLSEQIAAQQQPFAKWAEEQERSLTGIQRALLGSVGKPGKSGTSGIAGALTTASKLNTIGAAGVLSKSRMGALGFSAKDAGVSASLAKSLTGITPPRVPSALLEALIQPSTRYQNLARALATSLRAHRGTIASPGLSALLRKQTFTFPEVINAGSQAAALIADEGAKEDALAVREISADLAKVAATPTAMTVERLATALSAQLEVVSARVGGIGTEVERLAERIEENEQQRRSDRNADTALAVFLWYMALMVEVVRLILGLAARGQ